MGLPTRYRHACVLSAAALTVFLSVPARAQTELTESPRLVALRTEARAYEHGEGVSKDLSLALYLYCRAAKLGDAESQFSLGWIYAHGRGVTRDDGLASYFFTLAARQGHEQARTMVRLVGDPPAEMPECLRETRPPPPGVSPQVAIVLREATPAVEPGFVPVTAAQKTALELVNKLAPEYGISPRLALAVIRVESNFDPLARSHKNAQGLMQLIPETAARFNVSRPFDPAQNVRGGLAYLRWLLAYFQGNVSLVAAAYNAGEGTVNRYRGIPPFPETRAYVRRIMEFFGQAEHPYDSSLTERSPVLPNVRAVIGF